MHWYSNITTCTSFVFKLKWAKKKNNYENIEFRQGPAEDLSFIETGSVDLVLAGTAIHWFNNKSFIEEVRRILKPKTGNLTHLALRCDQHIKPYKKMEFRCQLIQNAKPKQTERQTFTIKLFKIVDAVFRYKSTM